MIRIFYIILLLVSSSALLNAEGRFRELHLQCEHYYHQNNFQALRQSLDAAWQLVDSASKQGYDQDIINKYTAFYHKDEGSYHYCISDIETGSYDKAIEHYKKSISLFDNFDSQSCTIVKSELAQLYYKLGEYQKAARLLDEILDYYSFQGIESKQYEILSSIALCKAQVGDFEGAVADINLVIEGTEHSDMHNEYLRRKAKILLLEKESYSESDYQEPSSLLKTYFYEKRDSIISNFHKMTSSEREMYWLRKYPFFKDCYRLEHNAPPFLYDVSLFAKSILLQFSSRKDPIIAPEWKDIQSTLKKDDIAIEFIQYEKNDMEHIAALLLSKEKEPAFVYISSVDEILNLQINDRLTVQRALSEDNPKHINLLYDSKDLRKIIWNDELRKILRNYKSIYFSPDGIIHSIAIEYMYPNDKTEFHRLTSTRELLRDREALKLDKMLLCGGIDYFATDTSRKYGNDKLAYDLISRKRPHFSYLEGAEAEIKQIYTERSTSADSIITGGDATEENILSIIAKYPIVLISTHGYYGGSSDRTCDDLNTWSLDAKLSESILILSSAQKNIYDSSFDPKYQDGILSARELSNTDLSNIQLFIASACQSALGNITSEGVLGIQRGLKNAGVQAMILSLWSIDDKATKHFITNLNKALIDGKSLNESFSLARKSMEEKIKVEESEFSSETLTEGNVRYIWKDIYNKPYYKNAFVLIDNLFNYPL